MATIPNFLQQSVKQLRKSITGIDDSYNNDWDILAELTQNSVDAIRKLEIKTGTIVIKVDSQNKAITIKDNGIGIAPNRIPDLLAPFETDKEEDDSSIGEKGVGLTFVLFTCNDFYIKSGSEQGTSEGRVIDAYNWKNSSSTTTPSLVYNEIEEQFQGTEVVLKKVFDSPLFQLSFNQLKFVLRTRTAIGNTNSLWDEDINIDVTLIHVNQDGDSKQENVKFGYWLPTEILDKQSKIDLEDYYEYVSKSDRTDHEKRVKLKDKVIYKKMIFDHHGRNIKGYACFVPKRKTWDDLTVAYSIATPEQISNSEWVDRFSYVTFHSGIFTSVKGMPTGISVDTPITGAQGAWPQVFILFEDRLLKFDIGRKSIHGMQAKIYKNYAKEVFREFQRLSKYISGDVVIDSQWDKDEIFAEIENLLPLDVPGTSFIKTPRDQEASVAGIFFECLGNDRITNIVPLVAGYKNKYDLYALWGSRKVVIEFKAKLSKILIDFNDETKLFNEVNCVVCWNVTEDDAQEFHKKGIGVEEISSSTLPGSVSSSFPHATHKLTLSGFVSPVYVIDMKIIVEKE